jgi:hypothetical protein
MSRKPGHGVGTVSRRMAEAQASAREHWISDPIAPRLLPLKKAAQHLGLSTWAMRERIWAGDIPVVRFDGGRNGTCQQE